jgi:alkylation response protein AidB-like acyl-CoA dehydrogenase
MGRPENPNQSTIEAAASSEGSAYRAPIGDIMLALDVAGLDGLLGLDVFHHVDRESVQLALEEFGRMASQVIAPSDRVGDLVGAVHDPSTGQVQTPQAFHHAYEQYVKGGWGALPFPSEFGGGDFPAVVGLAIREIFASANMALSLNPLLTQGSIEALLHWGSHAQKRTYLPRLLTGEWTGTMNLTEPDAGSDLGAIRTIAELGVDGQWLITGTKIFITWGEHDLAENIIHLVLARTPSAPAGTKGLSLFVVPKHLVRDDGTIGASNSLRCLRIEKKLGIHGSPTCVMEFNAASGELVGPLHGGIRAMFTMMNAARLSVGTQGPAVAERAFQNALIYASNRLQGQAIGVVPPSRSVIIEHPDVRRMLLTMTTTTQASRLLLYLAGAYGDQAIHAPDGDTRNRAREFADLLTPIAKAWSTDVGFSTTSLGVQVLGGAGYIEEFGMAQRLRDARIAPIYEGTNGIQALDLVTRKISRDGGMWMRKLLDKIASAVPATVPEHHPLEATYAALKEALQTIETVTQRILASVTTQPTDVAAGATSYLELCGITVGGWLMARRAELAISRDHPESIRIIGESNFFADEVMARGTGLVQPILAGARRLDVPIGSEHR